MLVSTLVAILLPVATLAAPGRPERGGPATAPVSGAIPKSRMALREGAEVGLTKRKLENCAIVSSDGSVKCRYHANTNSEVITTFAPGTKHDFNCYSNGECIGGNCTWDYANNWDCFVSGYYTDSKCTAANLGTCGFS